MTVQQLLATRKATVEEAQRIFDTSETVDLEFMLGRWKGYEIITGHPMDGLLDLTGWYGKIFRNPEEVHPLLFYAGRRQKLVAVNPAPIPLHWNFPKIKLLGTLMALLRPFLRTKKARARIRMVEYRGKLTGAMIYDHKAIIDVFVRIDDNTMLGAMDMKGIARPYFFVLERDETPFKIKHSTKKQ